jgi:DNA-directed RNA polymerase specialized sigma24 family protein
MKDMPHPEVLPAEVQDWRPLLDRELALLPWKYQSAIVLCDLEGRPRKEAARQLGVSEGTLSSRLARGSRAAGQAAGAVWGRAVGGRPGGGAG